MNFSVKMTLTLFQPLSVIMTMVLRQLRQRFLGSSECCYRLKRLLQMLLVCYSSPNSQNMSMGKCWLLTYQDTSGLTKKAAEIAQKKKQELVHGKLYLQWK